MTKDEILAAIKRYDWYQTIPLPYGISTPGETKEHSGKKLEMMQLPQSLKGQRVLDIGCNEGFFTFEAEQRGAAEVLGIDNRKTIQDKFELLRKILNLHAQFRIMNIYDLDPREVGEFDLVFFLAVFHHMRFPFLALDKIASVTRGMAIMEIVEAVPKQPSEQAALVRRLGSRGQLRMLPTRSMLLEMLAQAGFDRVQILGTHRYSDPGEKRKMFGYAQHRVLLKAYRSPKATEPS